MAEMNLKGLKCPEPIMKLAAASKDFSEGEMVEIVADCPSFPKDIEAWCEKTGKHYYFVWMKVTEFLEHKYNFNLNHNY